MTTPHQIRAARALLGLSRNQAARLAGIDRNLLLQAEDETAERDLAVFDGLEKTFVKQGVVFIEDGEDGFGPGVRLKQQIGHCSGIRPENLNSANDG
ncbi:helix-turn-helix domain-containing protein [Martelella soudanensis]|uniref:helix-turn-helix domain-containing protein n=1 Tax=unclassified Martelella TaxID=2629616 RepID=UPI0015DE1069|nr:MULTISPECIES: DNA-binding protein [unclassified Martelella]